MFWWFLFQLSWSGFCKRNHQIFSRNLSKWIPTKLFKNLQIRHNVAKLMLYSCFCFIRDKYLGLFRYRGNTDIPKQYRYRTNTEAIPIPKKYRLFGICLQKYRNRYRKKIFDTEHPWWIPNGNFSGNSHDFPRIPRLSNSPRGIPR